MIGSDFSTRIQQTRLLAIVRERGNRPAIDSCRVLIRAGITLIETTSDSTDAFAAVEAIRSEYPDVICGVGTVLDEETAETAIAAGAQFLVTPVLRKVVAAVAEARGVELIQGAFTPKEVLDAWELGCTACKLYPAVVGGPEYLRLLAGPFPEIPLIAVGGITVENARDYLEAGAVAVAPGAALASAARDENTDLHAWFKAVSVPYVTMPH